jgi:2-keto-4-pentenoate hydratase/2-oxohepta-3-ene-1,7-dioic acid hydratase in catechol pathway
MKSKNILSLTSLFITGLLLTFTAQATDFLTFSKLRRDDKTHFIYVIKTKGKMVDYIDLTDKFNLNPSSPLELFTTSTYDQVKNKINSYKASDIKKASIIDLVIPFHAKDLHLCAGLNYKDHVEETGQLNSLVVFPKVGKVTSYGAIIKDHKDSKYPELLDYEAEIGLIFDRDIHSIGDLNKVNAGFFIVNDVTDRAPQIYYAGDISNFADYSFTMAKSKPGYTVVSPIFVVPRNWRDFYKNLAIKLKVNGETKQNANSSFMTSSLETIVEKTLSTPRKTKWPLLKSSYGSWDKGIEIPLLENDFIPAGTIIMTGTPSGVIFQKPTKEEIIFAKTQLNTLNEIPGEDFKHKIKHQLILNYSKTKTYLKPGDEIISEIENLGELQFSIR